MNFSTLLRLLCLLLIVSKAHADWRVALPGWDYQFPSDHGSHPGFKTEWWYFTGNLRAKSGEELGYQLTFFRQGVTEPSQPLPTSRFIQRDVKFAHFAVSDISRKKFHHFQKLSRGAFGDAGFDDGGRIAWIENWSCERTGLHDFHLKAQQDGISVDLKLVSPSAPVIHGREGVSQKAAGEGRASHYYSLTRMKTSGTVGIDGDMTLAVARNELRIPRDSHAVIAEHIKGDRLQQHGVLAGDGDERHEADRLRHMA
jgi:predicted secreted hydrolase